LADQALAAWQRDENSHPLPSETSERSAMRHKAGTLGLIGLSIESDSSIDHEDVIVELESWNIGDALNAADEAGLLNDLLQPS
jgi:hypothetical protein